MFKRILLALFLCIAGHAQAVTATFTADTSSTIPNPGRGFYILAGNNGLLDSTGQLASDLASIRDNNGFRLALVSTTIPTTISGANLTTMISNFSVIRSSGMKVILIFACGQGPDNNFCDPTVSQVQAQTAALQPVMYANRDVIHTVQAGFLGVYGEWAEVGNGNDSKANKRLIKDAVFAMMDRTEVPVSFTQVYPMQEDWYSGLPVLSASIAFGNSKQARTGFYNDCFMVNNGDAFTYPGPATVNDFVITSSRASQRSYVAAMTEYAPFGFETCTATISQDLPLRTGCTDINDDSGNSGGILNEGPRYHANYGNYTYSLRFIGTTVNGVVQPTPNWTSGGCLTTVSNMMGYRFQFDQIVHAATATKGSVATFTVNMRNYGWSRLFDTRVLQVLAIHSNGVDRFTGYSVAQLRACPSQATSSNCQMTVRAAVPAGQLSGTYTIYLQMPSAYSTTQARTYTIRPANANSGSQVWDDTNGRLPTGTTIVIP